MISVRGGPSSSRSSSSRRALALAGRLVAEVVDEPREPVDGTEVRPGGARRQEGDDREVLAGGPRVDAGGGELGSVE